MNYLEDKKGLCAFSVYVLKLTTKLFPFSKRYLGGVDVSSEIANLRVGLEAEN